MEPLLFRNGNLSVLAAIWLGGQGKKLFPVSYLEDPFQLLIDFVPQIAVKLSEHSFCQIFSNS
jgi:hypothetical protein